MLIHQEWLVFPYCYFILDLSSCVHRTNIYIYLSTEITELFAYCVCRFLIFKGLMILIGASHFLDTCVRECSDTFDSINCRMVDCRYTCRHRHKRIEEHKGSVVVVGNHLREQHDLEPDDIAQSFRILRKCQNKFDCLIF